jgi:hypothetical protein
VLYSARPSTGKQVGSLIVKCVEFKDQACHPISTIPVTNNTNTISGFRDVIDISVTSKAQPVTFYSDTYQRANGPVTKRTEHKNDHVD